MKLWTFRIALAALIGLGIGWLFDDDRIPSPSDNGEDAHTSDTPHRTAGGGGPGQASHSSVGERHDDHRSQHNARATPASRSGGHVGHAHGAHAGHDPASSSAQVVAADAGVGIDPPPSPRLQALLGDPTRVQVGKLQRLELNTSQPLWTTRYQLRTRSGELVEVQLPGGTDGELVQRVGHVPAPEDGSEVALTWDERGRPVWSYHQDGTLTGGSLEDTTITWP